MSQDIYFRQLLAGRDVGRSHSTARQMRNFMYAIDDPAARQALVVDLAWEVASLVNAARAEGYEIAGALVAHYHPDHVDGDLWGLYPGHHYGPTPTSTIGDELAHNHYLRVRSLEDWRRLMG